MKVHIAALICAAALVTVSACHSNKTTSGEGAPINSVGTTSSDTSVPTDTVAPPTDDSDTPTPTTSSATPTTSTTTPAAHSNNTCAFAQLGIRALRGSGAQQREYAAIMFSNKGTKSCTMYGFPGVSLRYQGRQLGSSAGRDLTAPLAIVRLKPGDLVQADIVDNSSCQAPLSDTVRVYPPDSKSFVDLPLELRGCTITVKPVAAS